MYFLLLLISDSALLPLSATGGGRKATPSSPLFGKKICKIKKPVHQLYWFNGADDGARTRYLHLGKVALYQMSYIRIFGASGRNRTIDTGIFSPLLYRLSYRGKNWRPGTGSNRRPLAWQASVLTNWTTGPNVVGTTGLEPVTLCL